MTDATMSADEVRQRVIRLVDNWGGDDIEARVAVIGGLLFRIVDRVPDVVAQVIDDSVLELALMEYDADRDDER